ncbi:hypothetical protein JOF28_002779 [Leucobacter exalbidus]|uniref:DUF3046 domain-containing protein n=1 Tax=Leucobacter exalbidus TaxID=662960 RepID=A0A940PP45_9MICO|nr:hypothetical protein [Leucobacter exalbidus]
MRISEFHRACAAEFGEDYAAVLLRDHWLRDLGGTAQECLDTGVEPRAVWAALCDELDVPMSHRHGRGLRDVRR